MLSIETAFASKTSLMYDSDRFERGYQREDRAMILA